MKRSLVTFTVAAVAVAILAPSANGASKTTKKKSAAKTTKKKVVTTVAPTSAAPATAAPTTAAAATAASASSAKPTCPNGDSVNVLVAYEANQPAGVNFKRGVEFAISEINKADGVVGCKIKADFQDTQNIPDRSKQVIAKGLESKPFAVFGTVFSGSTLVNMVESQRAKTPQFTGGEAASLTDRNRNGNNDYIFRTSFGQSVSFPKVARFIAKDLKLTDVTVVYINNDFGIGGRDAARNAFKAEGITISSEVVGQPGQTDFSAEVAKVNNASGKGVFVYMNETENANFLREYKRQGGGLPLIGETTLTAASTLGLAGRTADGASAHVGLSSAAPMFESWVGKYLSFTKAKEPVDYPDHNSIKGWFSVHVMKEMVERQNSFDQAKFTKELHCAKITTAQEPGIFLDVAYDANGDLDRQSFLATVVNGEEKIRTTLPALGVQKGC
jgi:branched-chain amino acid transport system substrate-binding protein